MTNLCAPYNNHKSFTTLSPLISIGIFTFVVIIGGICLVLSIIQRKEEYTLLPNIREKLPWFTYEIFKLGDSKFQCHNLIIQAHWCICGFMPNLHKKSWMVSIHQLRGQNFAIFDLPPLHGQFLYPERGQKQTFFDPLPPSSCPRSYWMTPNGISFKVRVICAEIIKPSIASSETNPTQCGPSGSWFYFPFTYSLSVLLCQVMSITRWVERMKQAQWTWMLTNKD